MAAKHKRNRSGGARHFFTGFYRCLVAVSALIVIIFCTFKLLTRRPDTVPPPPPVTSADPEASARPGPETPALVRKEDTWTFLLMAEDQASGSVDTIMVCTYDTVRQQVGLVSVPRDTLVVRSGWKYHKLNAAYTNGNTFYPPDGGIAELRTAVSEIVGFPLDYYILVDTHIFVDLVNAVDGIDFNVPVRMSYNDPTQDLHIHYEPGLQHLNGKQALEVARCRKNSDGPGDYPHNIYDVYPDADVGRTRTQQEMLKVLLKKILSRPQKLSEYVKIFSERVTTDLSLSNMLWLTQPALGFDFAGLTTATLPGDGTALYDGISCYALDAEASLAVINDSLNPYTTPITADMVRMIQP